MVRIIKIKAFLEEIKPLRFDIKDWDEHKFTEKNESIQNPTVLNVDDGKLSILRFKAYQEVYSISIGLTNLSKILDYIRLELVDFKVRLKNHTLFLIKGFSEILLKSDMKSVSKKNGSEMRANIGGGYYSLKYSGDSSHSNAQLSFLVSRTDDYDPRTDRLIITLNRDSISERLDLYLRDISSIEGKILLKVEENSLDNCEVLYEKTFEIKDKIWNFLIFRQNLIKLIKKRGN